MNLALRKSVDGTGFVICVESEMAGKQLVIPLSPEVSGKIDVMVTAEGINMESVLLPPHLRGRRPGRFS